MNTLRHLALASLLFLSVVSGKAFGQNLAIKSNILDDIARDVNIGAEIALSSKWTLDVPVSLNLWNTGHDRKWKHYAVQPGVRYWFCDPFAGHFVGVHAHGGQYNLGGFDGRLSFLGTDFRKLKDTRYQGWFAGAGVSYGYAWILHEHWNIEAELGIGYSYTRYDRFRCAGCGKKIEENRPHNYFGLTKLAVNVEYVF